MVRNRSEHELQMLKYPQQDRLCKNPSIQNSTRLVVKKIEFSNTLLTLWIVMYLVNLNICAQPVVAEHNHDLYCFLQSVCLTHTTRLSINQSCRRTASEERA